MTRTIVMNGGMVAGLIAFCIVAEGHAADGSPSADAASSAERPVESAETAPPPEDFPPPEPEPTGLSDPLQPFNRAMYTVNDRLYFWVLKPVGQGYKQIAPEPVRNGIDNFFQNLRFPGRGVNDLLQAKFKQAGEETAQFLVNSTVGVLGFMTPAQDRFGLNPPPEDTGQSLGTWGLPSGPYIVLPILGPSHARHTVGRVGDYFLDPLSYLDPFWLRWGIRSEERINAVSLRIGDYEAIKESALDPYTAIKDGYHQRRSKQVEE